MVNRRTRRQFLRTSSTAAAGILSAAAVLPSASVSAATGRKIKIGQLGTGHAHAAGKMAALRRSADYELVGVVEPDGELRREAQQSSVYQDLRWLTRQQLLNIPGLEAVAVETRVPDLLEAAQTCVEAGLHVHLDKPPGASLPRFRRVLETAASKQRVVQMGYMYRYNPAVVFMRQALQKGWLGEIFEVHTVMSKVASPSKRRRFAAYRGGVMFELGCHVVDLLVGVLGKPDQVTAYHQHASSIDDQLQDNMLAVCTYPRAIATVKSSAMEVEGFARRHFVVCGSEGTLHIQPLDAPSVRLALSKPRDGHGKGIEEIPFGRYDRYVGDVADLARIIRGEKGSDYPPEHDLAAQETLLRACDMPLGA